MQSSRTCDRLSAVDSLFLYLERPETPINIGATVIFDGPIAFKSFTRFVESKLPLIPRYRQRVVTPPLNIAHPKWEYDPQFDISRHVRHVQLAEGTEAELQSLAGQTFTALMDRNHPLWDMTLVDGLSSGGSALIARIHHCLADGIAGVGLMNLLMDKTPAIPALPRRRPFKVPPAPDPNVSLIDDLFSSYSDLLDRIVTLQTAALNLAFGAVGGGLAGLTELLGLLPEFLKPVERLPFNQPCLAPRKVAWTAVPMSEVKAVRTAAGVTVNDYILSMVTTALRRYSEVHGASVSDKELRVFVPLNLRGCDTADTGLGNRISIMPVNLPLDIRDPMKLLAAIHERTCAAKASRLAEFIYMAGTCLGMLPPSLQALAGPLSPLITFPIFNLVCTNVPGPQFPVYLLGRKALTYYPHVPIGNDWGIGCAVQSYDGNLFFGLTADSAAVPDVRNIADLLDTAFSHVRNAAGIPLQKRRRAASASASTPKQRAKAATPVSLPDSKPGLPPGMASKILPPIEELTHALNKRAAAEPWVSVPRTRPKRRAKAETPAPRPETVLPFDLSSEKLPPPQDLVEPLDQGVAAAPHRIVS